MLKIYLAGPDVFSPNARACGKELVDLCQQYGFEGIFPLDAELLDDGGATPLARRIYDGNLALLRAADGVMANLRNFRGHEPDSGTCFEVGYAVALGKPVWAYGAPRGSIVEQVGIDAAGCDGEGCSVEDFGHSRNLMLVYGARLVEGDAQACLAEMRAFYA